MVNKIICYAVTALMLIGVTAQTLMTPVRAESGPVRIVIETTLRHNVQNPQDDSFTYRVRWRCSTSGPQTDYITVYLSREGNYWTGSNYAYLGNTSVTFTVAPIRGVGRYVHRPESRSFSGRTGSVTIRFTHTPDRRDDNWDNDWNNWGPGWGLWDNDWDRWEPRWDFWDYNCDLRERCRNQNCWHCWGRWPAHGNIAVTPTPTNNPVPASTVNSMETTARLTVGERAVVTERGRTSISPLRLRSLHNAAQRHGRTAVFNADTLSRDRTFVQGRLTVEPGMLLERTSDLLLGVYTDPGVTGTTYQLFRRTFTNNIAVVRLSQQGEFGARMRVAARVDLAGLNTNTLIFYAYESATRRPLLLRDVAYYIDGSGYLVFHTDRGGDIIIADRPLVRR